MMRLAAVMVVAAAFISAPLCYASAAGIGVYALQQPDSPIQMTSCSAGIQFNQNRWGTNSSQLNTSVDFSNESPKTAVAILFRFQLTNALGNVVDDIFQQSSGVFSPNAVIKGNHWSDTDTWPGLGVVQCSVHRIQFSDGSVWTEPPKPTPTPTPAAGT